MRPSVQFSHLSFRAMRILSYNIYRTGVFLAIWAALGTHIVSAQDVPSDPNFHNADSVVQRIYTEGMQHSRTEELARVLMDSIGPRLTGSPANRAANDWLVRSYSAWGIPAHNEQYGTWRDWTRGPSRIELVAPRMRTLEATALAWSPATPPGGVTGDVVALPPASDTRDADGFARWLKTVRGKFVLLTVPQLSCRPDTSWARYALPAEYQAMRAARDSARADWRSRVRAAGQGGQSLDAQLAAAGVAGILTSWWSGGWGVSKIMWAGTTTTPVFGVSCEDYGLLARLAAHGQHPRVRAFADVHTASKESPVYNTIAELKGTEHPEQYVMLSAHLDSWDAGSGATDNGTGTIVILEAMRILKLVYPHPKRTILVGHWSGEEEGEFGSDAFAEDHPEIVRGLQALFNQDDGTGRITNISSSGLAEGPVALTRWMSPLPASLTDSIQNVLGAAEGQSTDVDAFACRGAPAFDLNSVRWNYGAYTWHTNRDTFDKISFDEVERTATLVALLVYEASEDPQQFARTQQGGYSCSQAGRNWNAARAQQQHLIPVPAL
jgi:carboxypeptidase Q